MMTKGLRDLARRESTVDPDEYELFGTPTRETRRVRYIQALERRVDTLEETLNQMWAMVESLEKRLCGTLGER